MDTFPVIEIDQKEIVDTNGAGDAFVGGMAPSSPITFTHTSKIHFRKIFAITIPNYIVTYTITFAFCLYFVITTLYTTEM